MSDPNRKESSYSEKPNSSDTISRQSAINEIARWKGYLDDDMIMRIQIGLKRLPPTQPEIIYCKNCIYYRWNIDMCDYPYSTAHNVVHEYDYCSKAERRTDEP